MTEQELNKACEWLKENADKYIYDAEVSRYKPPQLTISGKCWEDFRKAMSTKTNPLFEQCLANVDPDTRAEVWRNMDAVLAWHKTSEELPKDKRFFACHDFSHIEVLEYSKRKNGYWNTKGSFFAEPEASQYFTHWMEIPELPEED